MSDQVVNVFTPEGELASLPASQLAEAKSFGFSEASPADYAAYEREQKFGTPLEQAKTFAEAAAQGATFGLAKPLETKLGVPLENIQAREEVNPLAHGAGQIAGLAGSALIPGIGEANVLSKAGRLGAAAVGLGEREGMSALSQIGSAGVKNAVETMLLTGGDEVSNMLAGDPNTSLQTAMVDTGLSGLIGAGLGAGIGSVSPLWKATAGPKLTQFLDLISKKANGIDGTLPDEMVNAFQRSGIEAPGEVKALLSDNPLAREMAQNLMEAGTASGTKARDAFNKFKGDLSDVTLQALNKTPQEVSAIENMSQYELGSSLKKDLTNALDEQIGPISKQFDEIKAKYAGVPVSEEQLQQMTKQLADLGQNEGYMLSPSSAQAKLIGTTIDELKNIKTLDDLRKYQSIIGDKTFGNLELRRAGQQVKNIFRNIEGDVVTQQMTSEAPELMANHLAARESYGKAMNLIDDLNDRLRVGKYIGPGTFFKKLEEMDPETVLKRLSDKNDAGLLTMLSEQFPTVAEKVKSYQLDNLITNAARKARGDEAINTKAMLDSISKLSPEMRQFLLSPEQLDRLDSLRKIMDVIPDRRNPSGTAGTLDALWKRIPNTAIGLASWITGHGAATSIISSILGPNLLREGEDAIKLGLLKYLGNGQHISAEGFKGMIQYIDSMVKGENALTNSVKNLFKAGKVVLPEKLLPSEEKRNKLNKKLDSLRQDNSPLLDVGGTITAYLPDHGGAMGSTANNAVQYLQSIKPQMQKMSPLDAKPVISDIQKAQYERTLDIAEQPLVVLNHIKEGSLTPQDVVSLNTMYPSLYNRMKSKITNEIISAEARNEIIPYKTKMSLSMFLAHPLDSTLTPTGIQNNQMAFMPQAQPQMQGMKPKHSFANLGKSVQENMTSQQAREARKLKG